MRIVWLAAVVIAGAVTAVDAVGQAVRADPGALQALLTAQGYEAIELHRLPTGHFAVRGSVDGLSLDLILDTGASHTVLDEGRAARFGLLLEDRGGTATGVGANDQRVQSARLSGVEIGDLQLEPLRVTVMDLSSLNVVLDGLGEELVDGIAGADVLTRHDAVIDYATMTLFLRERRDVW